MTPKLYGESAIYFFDACVTDQPRFVKMAGYYHVLFLLQFYGQRRSLFRGRFGEAVVIRGYTVFKSIPTLFLLILAHVKLHKKTIFFVKS